PVRAGPAHRTAPLPHLAPVPHIAARPRSTVRGTSLAAARIAAAHADTADEKRMARAPLGQVLHVRSTVSTGARGHPAVMLGSVPVQSRRSSVRRSEGNGDDRTGGATGGVGRRPHGRL